MELTNDFRVSVPVDQAWDVLTDVERIAPCLPGAELKEVEGDEYRGIVKVKVGPITAQYRGKATFVEKNDGDHRAVLRAEGRDTRGQGNANATITATLTPDGDGTAVSVVTDLVVTGKVAQFGRGVLADVSSKLLTQFVQCLENDLLSSPATGNGAPSAPADTATGNGPAPAARAPKPTETAAPPSPAPAASPAASVTSKQPAAATATSGPRRIESRPAEPVDLLEAAGIPAAKRAIPIVAGVLLVLWFLRRRRRG